MTTCTYCKKEFKRLASHTRHCKARKGEIETKDVLLNDDNSTTHIVENMTYTSGRASNTSFGISNRLSRWQRFKNWVRRLVRR